MERIKTLIMGAAGRDFHNFNCVYRNNKMYEVVLFYRHSDPRYRTAASIPPSWPASCIPRVFPFNDESDTGCPDRRARHRAGCFSPTVTSPTRWWMHKAAHGQTPVAPTSPCWGGRLTEGQEHQARSSASAPAARGLWQEPDPPVAWSSC